ncbi:hypothetical protein Q1695_015760 [Nippostrongylus brasiliensis]|nr:hypothetical protein Q1695_015760 [Nippostrongylus brasiliensis]
MAAAHLLLLSILFLGVHGKNISPDPTRKPITPAGPTDILDVLERISDIKRESWNKIVRAGDPGVRVCDEDSINFFSVLPAFCYNCYKAFSSQERHAFDKLVEIATHAISPDADEEEVEKEIKQVFRGEGHTFCERVDGLEEFCSIEPATPPPAITMPKELIDQLTRTCQLLKPRYHPRPYTYNRHTNQLSENVMELCKLAQYSMPNTLPFYP